MRKNLALAASLVTAACQPRIDTQPPTIETAEKRRNDLRDTLENKNGEPILVKYTPEQLEGRELLDGLRVQMQNIGHNLKVLETSTTPNKLRLESDTKAFAEYIIQLCDELLDHARALREDSQITSLPGGIEDIEDFFKFAEESKRIAETTLTTGKYPASEL